MQDKSKKLSPKRKNDTYRIEVGGQVVYIGVGTYKNGDVGEVFIDLHKEGATLRSMFNCFAIAVSIGLQYGAPLSKYVDLFSYVKFDPNGHVDGYDEIKEGQSIVDVIFRMLAIEYLKMNGFSDTQNEQIEIKKNIIDISNSKEYDIIEKVYDTENVLDKQAKGFMGDAPTCVQCGHITVRNGKCYRCLNCGTDTGCG